MGQELWGISPTNNVKPNWLTDAQKENTVATKSGWVYKHPSGIYETLVAIANLSGKLGAASITAVRWLESTLTVGLVGTLYVDFDEPIVVTGSPTLVLTGGSALASLTKVNGGTGYTTASVEIVGDGFGATATAVVEVDGSVTVTLDTIGSGYRTATVVVTGDGVGADYTVILDTAVTVTATYDSLEGVGNSMVFTFTAPADPDNLAVLAQTIALNGGTVTEALEPATTAVLVIGTEDLPATLQVVAA